MGEKTRLASSHDILKSSNYREVMTMLSRDPDKYRKPYVSVRIGVKSNMLSYELITHVEFKEKTAGWSFDLVDEVLLDLFKLISRDKGICPMQKGEPITLRRYGWFKHHMAEKIIRCKYDFFDKGDVPACVCWRILADPEHGVEADSGDVYLFHCDALEGSDLL